MPLILLCLKFTSDIFSQVTIFSYLSESPRLYSLMGRFGFWLWIKTFSSKTFPSLTPYTICFQSGEKEGDFSSQGVFGKRSNLVQQSLIMKKSPSPSIFAIKVIFEQDLRVRSESI